VPPVSGDAFLLRQALVNMIENAADFSPAHGEITLRISHAGDEVRVEVSDRGPGVPDYALPRVFERFYSLPRPGGGSRSSGLGLCFVAEVAALHGGAATLNNREDQQGAVAVLQLAPIKTSADAAWSHPTASA
ncbi:MAG: ATP-binding protein, partial [Lysobacter sp.]